MKKKKIIIGVCAVLVVIVAIIALLPNGWPVDSSKTSGDIGKAERFSRKDAEPISNMKELILNDADYKDGIVVSNVVMQARANQFDALVRLSNDAAGSLKDFEAVLSKMNAAKEMVGNVCQTLGTACEDLDATLGGEDRPDLEQNTINASLAYLTLQKHNDLADAFIETADKYLKNNTGDDKLKLVRDSWLDYQLMTAALEGNDKAAGKLEKKGYTIPPEKCLAETENIDAVSCIALSLASRMAKELAVGNNLAKGLDLALASQAEENLKLSVWAYDKENLGAAIAIFILDNSLAAQRPLAENSEVMNLALAKNLNLALASSYLSMMNNLPNNSLEAMRLSVNNVIAATSEGLKANLAISPFFD